MSIDDKTFENADLAIFIPSFRGGGAEKIAVSLANAISAQGHKVDLIVATRDGPYSSAVSPQVRILELNCKRMLSTLIPLVRYLQKRPPRTLLSLLNHVNLIAILAHKVSRSKSRLVISERNSPMHAEKWLDKYLLLPVLTRILYGLSDKIICISEGIRRDLLTVHRVPKHLLVTIHNPINLELVHKQAAQEVNDQWLSDPHSNVMITAGRLVVQKDLATLIYALKALPSELNCKLIILGIGPLEHVLKDLVASLGLDRQVKWLGFVENPYPWMARADLFVLSSAWEGFGNVLVEAMACGTQVISTNCPSGPSEILEEGVWGDLVPVGDHETLAHAIDRQLTTPRIRDVEVRARDFSLHVVVKRYLEALHL